MKQLKRLLMVVFLCILAWWLLGKTIFPSLKNIFSSQPVVIDESPILVKEIKSIGQLITYSSFDEVVADSVVVTKGSVFVNSFNRFAPLPILPSADKQLVLIGKGKILAGIDLTLLSDTDVISRNDSLRLTLPKAKILDAILNPSDFETFVEKGNWTDPEVILVKAQARRKMIARAIQQNILLKADTKAKAIMENFLRNLGYAHVEIH